MPIPQIAATPNIRDFVDCGIDLLLGVLRALARSIGSSRQDAKSAKYRETSDQRPP